MKIDNGGNIMDATKIKWSYNKGSISKELINDIEQKINVTFPSDYKECVMINNGCRPSIDSFNFEGHEGAVFNALLPLNLDIKGNLFDTYQMLNKTLPSKIVPFASDPFGNYLCFDYSSHTSPKIVFWDHETRMIKYITDNFSSLLNVLY